jgi:hypothetical protein
MGVKSRPAPRVDVTSVCPQIADQLPEDLASAWQQVGRVGTVQVRFTLRGDEVLGVETTNGPRRYHHFVRSAMHDLSCRSDRGAEQSFVFYIRFDDALAAPGTGAVSLLTE